MLKPEKVQKSNQEVKKPVVKPVPKLEVKVETKIVDEKPKGKPATWKEILNVQKGFRPDGSKRVK